MLHGINIRRHNPIICHKGLTQVQRWQSNARFMLNKLTLIPTKNPDE